MITLFSPTRAVAAEVTGETLLCCAVVQQAWLDTTAANADIRQDALRWWDTPEAIRPWAEALDLSVEALTAAVRRRQGPGHASP